MNARFVCTLVAAAVVAVDGGLLTDRIANSSIGRYSERIPQSLKLPPFIGGKHRDPAPTKQPPDQVPPSVPKTSSPPPPPPQPSVQKTSPPPPPQPSAPKTQPQPQQQQQQQQQQQPSRNQPDKGQNRGDATTEKTVKLETTTHDRSIIEAPLKKCPEGQRMDPNRECRPNFVDTEDGGRK